MFDYPPPLNDDTLMFEAKAYPLISTRRNGDRLIGYANSENAEALYAAGTPPVHGLSHKAVRSSRVALVRIGDELAIERRGKHWVVSDTQGELGQLKWSHTDEGRPHAVSGRPMIFPASATLQVRRLVVSRDGLVVDFAGMTFTP